jgi:UEV domain
MVYLPYLHEWEGRTHDLVELCAAMSGVFSQEPPVYARSQVTLRPSTLAQPRRRCCWRERVWRLAAVLLRAAACGDGVG